MAYGLVSLQRRRGSRAEALSEGGSAAHHKQLDKAIQFIYKKYIIIYKKYMECSHG
jgi:hypothetical protein